MIYPENILILAPLSGFTDLPYRRAARRGGCRYAFTEMVDAASLAYASGGGTKLLLRGEEENFLAVQLVGSDPELLKRACDKLNDYDFSLLDFNLGCPVPKVVKKGAGAALGSDPERAVSCFEVLAKYSRFPLTVKMRILSGQDAAPTVELCRELTARGAQALTIHGRTREHFYTGTVNFSVIRAVREALPEIPVIANGGVHSKETFDIMRRETGCSRVMLAQGAMGNPWLFRELSGENPEPPTLDEWKEVILEHVVGMSELYGEAAGMRQARKIVHDYLKGRGFPGSLRAEASQLTTLKDLELLLAKAFPVSFTAPRKIGGTEHHPA